MNDPLAYLLAHLDEDDTGELARLTSGAPFLHTQGDGRQPLHLEQDGVPLRVYALDRGWWRDLAEGVQRRAGVTLPGLAPLRIVPVGEGAVVVAFGLPGATPLVATPDPSPSRDAAGGDLLPLLDHVLAECRALASALAPLHQAGLVWLDFNPCRALRSGDSVQLADLDLQLYPFGDVPAALSPHPLYGSPELVLGRSERVGPATDVYHLALHAYLQLAGLHPGGFPGEGPASFGFDFPPLRTFRPGLPPGVAPVVEAGVRHDPRRRFPGVPAFLDALAEGVERARARYQSRAPVWVDAGGLTVTGRTKAARNQVNQDALGLFTIEGGESPGTLVALVADGVSVASIGSGDLASHIACRTLEETLPEAIRLADSPDTLAGVLRDACQEASRRIATHAISLGPLPTDLDPAELMGTTALVGVARGGVLTLASVGDSRAYLVPRGGPSRAEQLTVDGDVRSFELLQGTPPEQVRAFGDSAHALFSCLGVCDIGAEGELYLAGDRSEPFVHHWPLLPGDVVVLCSDGLVEEGVFLEPDDLARIVDDNPGASAADLADRMVRRADAMQVLPSTRHPEGMGDNITCVVLRATLPPEAPPP